MEKRWLSWAGYAGMFVFGIVMALLGAVLPLISGRVGFDLAQAGNLFFAMNLCMLASTLSLGPVMDRFGKKPALLAGAVLVALALMAIASAASYPSLVIGVALLGIGGGALNGGTNTLIADLHADPAEKNAALNLLGVPFGFGALFLPFVIGSLVDALGLEWILRIAAALCIAAAALFLALRFPPPRHAQGLPLREAGRLARHPLVLAFGFLLFFQSGNEFTMGGYTSTFLTRELGSSITSASYLLSVYWASIMVSRVALSKLLLKLPGAQVVAWSALAAGAGVVLLLAAQSAPVAAAALLLVGMGFASIFPTTLGLAGTRFASYSGTVFGILIAIALVGGMTLPWAVGQVAQAFSLRRALALAALSCLMIFALRLVIERMGRTRDKDFQAYS